MFQELETIVNQTSHYYSDYGDVFNKVVIDGDSEYLPL